MIQPIIGSLFVMFLAAGFFLGLLLGLWSGRKELNSLKSAYRESKKAVDELGDVYARSIKRLEYLRGTDRD